MGPFLPLDLVEFSTNEEIDSIGFLSPLRTGLERKRKHAWMMAQPPVVGFGTSETGTMDARLLTCAKSDDSPVIGISDRVGLSVLECECGDSQVCNGGFGQLDVDEADSSGPEV